jgi:hypothetical protein
LYDRPINDVPATPPPLDGDTPADLRGLLNFVNSGAGACRPERFDTAGHADVFLAHCELGYDGRALSARDTARLRRLRNAILAAIENPADPTVWHDVNEIAATAPVRLHIAAGPRPSLKATRDNATDAIVALLLDQCANAIATGRWNRLSTCARCRRVFYDNTRSRTRRWCSYATCGNRTNVAAYRTRARQ